MGDVNTTSYQARSRQPDLAEVVADGLLQIVALGDRAFRVRFQPSGAAAGMPASPILFNSPAAPRLSKTQGDGKVGLELPFIRCELHRATGQLRFFGEDGRLLLSETVGGRQLREGRLGDDVVIVAEQAFEAPADERLYGTGCFQDGALDLRQLPRRLTQVNSQISLPFTISSRGYGLLWHNQGMSEFNPLPHHVGLNMRSTGEAHVESVSTSAGGAEVTRRLASFEGEITIERDGRHAFLLDIGRVMGSRYRLDIDGETCVDFTNLWLPPTMSFFADLAPGTHRVTVEANDTDAPSLYYGPVEDTTVWRSPVADAIDYIVIAGPAADDLLAT